MECSLETLLKYEQPTKYIVASEEYSDEYPIPVLTAGKSFILGYTNEENGICRASISPVIIYDDFTTDSKYVDFDFKVKSSAMKILHQINKEDNLRYLFYVVSYLKYTPFSHKRTWISDFSKFRIKYRLPIEQNAIVSELDKIQAALDNKKEQLKKLDELIQSKFYEMFGDPVTNEKGWIKEELQSVFKVTSSKRILQSEWQNSGIPFYKVADIVNLINGNEVKPSTFIKKSTYDELYNVKLVPVAGDILITSRGTLGQCYIIREEDKFYFQDGMITWISPKIKNISPIYIKGIFSNNSFLDSLLRIANCSTVAYISIKQLSQIFIPLPPLPLQQAFAAYVEKVEQAKAIVNQEIAHLQELLDSRMDFYFRK